MHGGAYMLAKQRRPSFIAPESLSTAVMKGGSASYQQAGCVNGECIGDQFSCCQLVAQKTLPYSFIIGAAVLLLLIILVTALCIRLCGKSKSRPC